MATIDELLKELKGSQGPANNASWQTTKKQSEGYSYYKPPTPSSGANKTQSKSLQELIDKYKAPKISANAGQQQFLNTLTDPAEKYEYLQSIDPSRAATMRQNTEKLAEGYRAAKMYVPVSNQPDASRSYFRNFAVPPERTEEEKLAISRAEAGEASANKKLAQFDAVDQRVQEQALKEAQKRSAPTYAMLATLPENEVIDYLQEVNPALARSRQAQNELVETRRGFYGMTIDQYEKELAESEQEFYDFYTTKYNPQDPESVREYERLVARNEFLLENKDAAYFITSSKKYADIPHKEDFTFQSNLTFDSKRSREKLLEKGYTEHELSIYTYLYNTEGKESADRYVDYIDYMKKADENAIKVAETREAAKADAENLNIIWSSLKSVGDTIASGAGMMDAIAQKGGQVLGEMFGGGVRAPVDFYSSATPSVYATTVLQVNAENINNKHGTININPETNPLMAHIFNGKGWGDAYQLTMSMANSGIAAGMSAVIPFSGLAMLSGSAATSTMLQYAESGATDDQAIAMGLIAGFAEAVMEALPMESLLNGNWAKSGFGEILKQGLTEGAEEGGTSLMNLAADVFIMAQNSDFQRNVQAYIDNGMDEEAAYKRACWDKVIEIGWDVVGGFASGSAMGSLATIGGRGAHTVSVLEVKKAQPLSVYKALTPSLVERVLEADPFDKQAIAIRDTISENGIDAVKAADLYKFIADNVDEYNATVYHTRKAMEEAAEATKAASEAMTKSAALQPVATEATPTTKTYPPVIQDVVNKLKQGPVTNAAYNAVYDAALADASLQAVLGVDLTSNGGLTKAQQRQAVKTALQDLANPTTTKVETVQAEETAPASEEAAPPTKEAKVVEVKAKTHSASAAKPKAISSLDVVVAAHRNGDKNAATKFTTAAMNSKPLQAQIKKAWGVDLSQVASNSEKRTLIFNAIKSRASEAQATEVEAKPEVAETNAKPASSGDFAKVLSKDEYIKDQGIYELPSKMQTDAYRQYVDSLTEAVASSQSITYNGEVMTFDKYLETRNAARAAEGKGEVDVTTARKMFYDNYVNELKAQEKEAEVVQANEKLVVALNAKLADFGSRCTVRLSTDEADFPKNIKGETAFYDANANEIVINARVATTAKIILRKFGHEIFHPAADVDSKLVDDTIKAFRELNDDGKLTGKAKEWMDNYDDRIATIRELYQRHENRVAKLKGREAEAIDDEKAKLELACDLFGELFEKTEMADGLVEKNPSAGATIVDRLNKLLAKLNLGHIETKEEKEIKAVADKLSSLEKRVKSALVQKAKSGEGVSKNHSISSMASAAGIEAIRDESGRIVFVAKDGTPINRVLPEDIKSSSGLGALIKAAQNKELHGKKSISEAEANKQYKAVAEIMNMIIETQDPDMVWQFVGASMFSAIKSNADGQYGTTVDFSTICRKTQDMISAMSHAMKQLGRGLTKAEVTQLQKKLIEEGSAVPCPVCYVFSRWAGIGSVLDKMAAWQEKYESYDANAIKARIEELSKTTKKTDLRKMLKAQDDEYQELSREKERLSRQLTALRKQLKAAKGEDAKSVQGKISIAELQRTHISDQIKTIEDNAAGELSWLINVRSQDGYKAVPKDILYDLENAEAFASDEYALSWKYRTSRGPSAGKAILPYADMRLGDMILGVGKNSADGNTLFAETTGEFTDKQMDAVKKAIIRTRAQNLIGGQRFQSTSDFRYDYALDYVMAFFEAQALGSNLQTYTKVIEFADMIAAVGGDVNLSVMPKDKGYKDGKLVFSNVTGISYEAALEANAKYDNAQLILVGINDEHIRLALEDSADTGGNTIGFVIPYHASGASIEEFIAALVSNLNEQFVKENYVDYSDVQGDKVKANATEEQSRRRDLRKQLLTGRHKADNGEGKMSSQSWSPEAADFELIVGESVDISNRSFEDLRAVEKKALAGDAEAIREYESWSAGVLRDLYEKLWTSKGAYNGVRLNSTQAAAIMPHEYWNTNTTRANAYVNGFIFRSYCYSMGLNPRFTGKNSSGKTVNHGDFADSTGYWKTLIDRPMYANDGTCRNQQAVNMSHFEKGMLTKEWAETHWGEYKIKEPSKTNAERAAEKFVAELHNSVEDVVALKANVETEVAYFELQTLNDYVYVQKTINSKLVEDGFFGENERRTVFSNALGIPVDISKKSIRETFGPGNRYQTLPSALKKMKIATVRLLPDIIANGEVVDVDMDEKHFGNKDLKYSYIQHEVEIDGTPMFVVVDIRRSKQTNLCWMHGVYLDKKISQTLVSSTTNVGNEVNKDLANGDMVARDGSKVKKNFSLDEDIATAGGSAWLSALTIDDLLKMPDDEFFGMYGDPELELDIEDIAEEVGGEPESVREVIVRKGLGDTYVAEGNMAVMTSERLDRRINNSGASRPDYANSYITRISPKDFLDLTVTESTLDRDVFDTRVEGDHGSTMKTWDFAEQIYKSDAPPKLNIDRRTGQVIGHNGRHRVRALEMAGIESVAIEVQFYNDGSLIKYGAKPVADMAISSQFDTNIETHISNIIPLNRAFRAEIDAIYGENAHPNASVSYSLENDELSALEDQLMADLDTTFSALDLVEGTAEISAEYVEAYNNAIAKARDLAIEQTQAVERLAAEMGRKREQAALKRTHQVKLKAIKEEAASKADKAKLAENMGHQREMLQQKRKYDAKLEKQKLDAQDKLENVKLAEAMGRKREMGQQKRKYEAKLATQKADYEQRLETAKEEAAIWLGNVKLAEKMGHQREMLQQKRELKEKAKIAVATEKEKGKAVADSLKEKAKQQRQLARNKAKIALRAQSAAKKKMAQEAIKNGEVKTVREYEAAAEFADVFKKDNVMKNATLAAQAAANKLKGAYRTFISGGQAVEAFSRRQKGVQARTLAVSLQSAETTIERIFKNGLVDTAGNTIGNSLADVLLVYKTNKNGKLTSKVDMQKMAIFQDYLLHAHNVDRMSIEEKAMAEVAAFIEEHPFVEGMTNKEIARIAALTDKEAVKEGEVETREILTEYLNLLENVNKAKNKPVFADSKGNVVSAETSRGIVAKYEAEHEWLAEKAQGLYEWWETFMRTWVVGTSITEEQYESMKALYPHYVPTFRVVSKGGKSFGGTTLSPTQAVKAAKGSTLSIIDIENSFARLVSNGVTGYRENELFKNIVDTFMLDDGETQEFGDIGYFDSSCFEDEAQKTTTDTEDQIQEKIETDEKVGLVKDKDGYRVSAWYNGELRSAYVAEEFFKGLQHFTGEDLGEVGKTLIRVGSAITGPMKTAITGINPSFAVRNISRDLPTAIVNSVSGASFIKYWGQAGYDMVAAGIISNEQLSKILAECKVDLPKMEGRAERYQNFVNLGGTNSGYYNANKGFIDNVKGDNIFSKGIQAMGAFNEATEAMTRYAEYIATLDRLGDTYENRLLAIYNSAEVTVNFGRHGKYGKVINAWIPYWNPAVQGIDKVVRSVIDSPEGKAWYKQAVKTLGRAALTSILPEALTMIAISALGRRDEWEKLTDRMKDTYYCIPWFKENRFLKIPKNREWGAILGTPLMRLFEYANGREDPFENYVETSLIPNFLPPGLDDAIGISQARDLWKNEDFAGRQIVPSAYQKGSKEFQYDADTSILARGLAALIGHKLGAMQVDYIIEAYFGDFGDMATQLFSPATWQRDPEGTAAALLDIVVSPWIGDNRYSNQDVSDYYELLDTFEMQANDAKNHGTEDAYHETPDYLSAAAIERLYGSQITALNKQAREMDDGVEKDAIKAEISRLATEALMLDAAIRSGDFSEYAKASTLFDADTTQALLELYKEVNTVGVFLQEPDRKFSVDGVEVVLSDAELETYSQNRRSIATAQVAELVSSSRYSKMSVEDREKAVGQVYDFATQLAKQDITNGEYKPATWITATQQAMLDTGVPISAVIDYRIALSAENDKPDVTSKQANSTIRGQLMADNSLPTNQQNAIDDIVFSDVTIIPNDKKVDYTSAETFVISQMSEGAQTRWADIKRRFQISAETYNKAWSIYYNDELTAAEKKAELGKLLGSSLRGNGLYRALGEKLDK